MTYWTLRALRRAALSYEKSRSTSAQCSKRLSKQATPSLKSASIRFTVDVPAEPLFLEADPARLTQIVVNLLNNAAKYTERGGEISLSVRREKNEAVIQVRDNGVGIPPDMLSRVFDMFVQAQGSSHHSQGGLGIGLTLVKRLVELHGGTIACQSAGLGTGSEFLVRLPAYPLGRTIRGAGLAHDAAKAAPCHILVIEDQSDAASCAHKAS